jgi:hypothetical protein
MADIEIRFLMPRRPIARVESQWWECITGKTPIIAHRAIGASSLAASYNNLANPGTNDASSPTPPTWNATDGWIFNGSTQYLSIGVITITENMTAIIRYSGVDVNADGYGHSFFGYDGAPNSFFVSYGDDGEGTKGYYISIDNQGQYQSGVIASAAVFGLTKAGNYIDGVADLLFSLAPSAFTINKAFGIGNYLDTAGSPSALWLVGNIQAFVLFNETLDSTEMATISAAMAAL